MFARSSIRQTQPSLQVHYQNVRGLRTKLSDFITATSASSIDAFCIPETWLHPTIHDGEVIDDTFNIFRQDRNNSTCISENGGGVLIALKKYFHAECIHIPDDSLEQIYVKIKCKISNIIVACVYIAPRASLNVYQIYLDTLYYLKDKHRDANFLITGDFNLPSSSPRSDCENLLYKVTYMYILSVPRKLLL
uniref:Endonuclease/exonuclease/phosphatase domain-containing protein n=1 Tax=Bactrocera latifrons TaxID=174628 RepID=A0A0K8WLF8_BACLA